MTYLRYNGPRHVGIIGPTRSGKSLACIVPTLLTEPESAIVYDEKGELYGLTAGWRATEADNIVLRFEPAALENTVRWNPFEEVRLGTPYEFRDMANVVEVLAKPQEGDTSGHFDQTTVTALTGIALHVAYSLKAEGRIVSPGNILSEINSLSMDFTQLCVAMRDNGHLGVRPVEMWAEYSGWTGEVYRPITRRHRKIAEIGQGLLNRDIRERSGIYSTADRMLRVFQDPIVAENTARSDFRIWDLMNSERPMSLYITTRGMDKKRLSPLVRLLLTLTVTRLCSAEIGVTDGQQNRAHKWRLLFAPDEFASLQGMPEIEEALAKMAGYGIKAYLAAQHLSQIVAEYGQNQSITGHCYIKVIYAASDLPTCSWVSELTGKATENISVVTESGRKINAASDFSRSIQAVGRPLLLDDEVRRIPSNVEDASGRVVKAGNVLVIIDGQFPIMARSSLYFLDEELLRRASIPAPGARMNAA